MSHTLCASFAEVNFTKIILASLLISLLTFTSKAQDVTSIKDSLRVDGGISLRNVLYGMSGSPDRRVPYSFVLGGNLNISKGDFSIPLSFTYSEQERTFSQPFNQFGMSPSYKNIKAYLGYNSISWNNYTLSGVQFLGAGVEYNPKKLRLGAMYGRFRRATSVDSIGFVTNQNAFPAYERWAMAGKIGYGNESNFVDLIFMNGKDKVGANAPLLKDSNTFVLPAENSNIGLKGRFAVGKYVSLHFDGGMSLFTRDIKTDLIETQVSYLDVLGKLRTSTKLYYGGEAGATFNLKGHTLGLNTKYIAPDYQSMGVYYMDNDVFSYGFNHAFSAWKSKINLNYGVNKLNDNLLNKKEATTIRIQPLVSLSFNPNALWGVELNWNNYYTQQEKGNLQLSDTFRMAQSNPGITITPHAQWGDTIKYHAVSLIYTKMQLIDNNPYTAIFSQYQATVVGANYSLNLLPKDLSANIGLNITKNKNNYTNEQAYGGTIGMSKSGVTQKWNVGSTIAFQTSNLSNSTSLSVNGVYNLKHKQSLNFGLTFLRSAQKENLGQNFNEVTFTLTYNKQFQYVHHKK